ncbi:MAG: hypothetical protein EOP11_09120 [Proteobacteria bacterium]|nr:MAG: hypothetical protein EOP11_24685 [Pseudomonadota bacterium]RZA06903.1 MAG: hypothetical protein EOP11_09120 [Pseudomonadota bacterium]
MGNKLFSQVTALTGLPEELIGPELKGLLERKGVAPEQVTMESLREALADYLAQVSLQIEGEACFHELDTVNGIRQ